MHSRNQSERNSTFVSRDQHHQPCHKSRKDAQQDPAAKSSDSLQQEEDEAHVWSCFPVLGSTLSGLLLPGPIVPWGNPAASSLGPAWLAKTLHPDREKRNIYQT